MRYVHIQLEDRNGITLMEVLIAIGILAIGLSSVAALMPAAGSQAKKAVVADRASSMAENALADAVTIGLTKPSSLVLLRDPRFGGPVSLPSSTSSICNWNRIVIDPLGDPELSEDLDNDLILDSNEDDGVDDDADGYLDGLIYAGLKRDGIFSFSGGVAADNDVLKLFSQGRDDLVYEEPASADALPTNQINNTRAFLGRTSCLWALESLNGDPVADPDQNTARLSTVLFHERDPSVTTVAAEINNNGYISWQPGALPNGRSIKQVFRRGTVVVRLNPYSVETASSIDVPAVYVLRAAPERDSTSVYAVADDQRLFEFQTGTTDDVRILLDSVGLAQKIVTLEGNSEYTLSDERKVTP